MPPAPCLASSLSPDAWTRAVYSGLRWRSIGPFRGGRVNGVSGVPGQPNTFYFGSVGGGVWKTTNAGRTWLPIFDSQPIASIGAIGVAPSNPNIVYVGTGEADMRSQISYGNGMYKSTDAGKTWTHIGLDNTRQIGTRARRSAQPRRRLRRRARSRLRREPGSRRLPHRATAARPGRRCCSRATTSARSISTSIRRHRRRSTRRCGTPGVRRGASTRRRTGRAAASTSRPTAARTGSSSPAGLPTDGLGRIGVAVAPSNRSRVYAIVDAKEGGLFRSDDAGATFAKVSSDARIWGRGWYFGKIAVDPKNADLLYISNTGVYRSRDGGRTFGEPFKGSPGGDDYHQLWISPDDSNRMILGGDQGAVISVDGLNDHPTWSSWLNQSTAQIYRVAVGQRLSLLDRPARSRTAAPSASARAAASPASRCATGSRSAPAARAATPRPIR